MTHFLGRGSWTVWEWKVELSKQALMWASVHSFLSALDNGYDMNRCLKFLPWLLNDNWLWPRTNINSFLPLVALFRIFYHITTTENKVEHKLSYYHNACHFISGLTLLSLRLYLMSLPQQFTPPCHSVASRTFHLFYFPVTVTNFSISCCHSPAYPPVMPSISPMQVPFMKFYLSPQW